MWCGKRLENGGRVIQQQRAAGRAAERLSGRTRCEHLDARVSRARFTVSAANPLLSPLPSRDQSEPVQTIAISISASRDVQSSKAYSQLVYSTALAVFALALIQNIFIRYP